MKSIDISGEVLGMDDCFLQTANAHSAFEILFYFFFNVHLFLSTERAVQHDPGLLCPAKNI